MEFYGIITLVGASCSSDFFVFMKIFYPTARKSQASHKERGGATGDGEGDPLTCYAGALPRGEPVVGHFQIYKK